uniref:Retrovirus-related Pol polyprotein from transposon TNT 1-94 n=1 Tax=Tanacetum cinerariifolium TaxID=118510 RepID=A0A6L2L8R3_TANCI|nr:retrovirus-related Pol polyprotein from transposon TNT 1-94 [Tanacetum cinerariifolium]
MIKKNNIWKLVDLAKGKNAIGVKWIYKTKFQPDGSIYKHKARLVVKGYSQVACVDFRDTFAHVAHHDTIKLLLAMAAQRNWKIHHLGVKSALYDLKQAPKAWYAKIDAHLLNHNFRRSSGELTLYMKQFNSKEGLIISFYVGDLLVIGSNDYLVKEFKKQMESKFDMSDMGLISYFLGMEIKQLPNDVHISQRKYASDMLKKFKMFLCKPVTSPLVYKCKLSKDDGMRLANPTRFRRFFGSLLYLAISRQNLAFAASFLSRFMGKPSSSHLGAAKRVLRYVKGSPDLEIMFERNKVVKLKGYADSDWAKSIDDSKSTSGYILHLIQKLLSDLDLTQEGPTVTFYDNKSTIDIAENPVQHGRTKHINIKADYSVFIYKHGDSFVAALIYIDDIVIAGNDTFKMQATKDELNQRFCIKDLGTLKYFVGLGILLPCLGGCVLTAYCDSYWLGCPYTQRSQTWYLLFVARARISWKTKKQSVVSRSSAEAEYRSMVESKEVEPLSVKFTMQIVDLLTILT